MLTTQSLLTFDELRSKCLRHMTEVHTLYGVGKFTNPDKNWLNEELLKIINNLETNKANFRNEDLINAFCSVVFEMEFGLKFYPNSLIKFGADIYRVDCFCRQYPICVKMLRYLKHSNGQLAKKVEVFTLRSANKIQVILNKDPLAKN